MPGATATEFQRDGACVLRGVLTAHELAHLESGVEANLAAPSERSVEGGGDTGTGRFFEDFRNWTRIPEYEDVIRDSRLGALAAELTGSDAVRLHHDHLLVKDPGTTIRTPWHQDQPFYNIDGADTVSFWIPLDPVPRESTLEFVAGSHAARTWYMPRGFFDDRPMVFEDGTFADVPDVEADRGAHTILGWELEPGDAVAFNMLTLHAAGGRATAAARSPCGSSATTSGSPSGRTDQPVVPRARRRTGARRRARPSAVPGAVVELIERFYAAFDRKDGDAMAACYAPDARFSDPAFGELRGAEPGAMWRMLTSQARRPRHRARRARRRRATRGPRTGSRATRSRRPAGRWSTTSARRSGSATA